MNLLTLEFEQPEIEAAYCVERFSRTSGAVIVVSAVNIALHTILTVQVPFCCKGRVRVVRRRGYVYGLRSAGRAATRAPPGRRRGEEPH